MAKEKNYTASRVIFQSGSPSVIKDVKLTFKFEGSSLTSGFKQELIKQNIFPGRNISSVEGVKEN